MCIIILRDKTHTHTHSRSSVFCFIYKFQQFFFGRNLISSRKCVGNSNKFVLERHVNNSARTFGYLNFKRMKFAQIVKHWTKCKNCVIFYSDVFSISNSNGKSAVFSYRARKKQQHRVICINDSRREHRSLHTNFTIW